MEYLYKITACDSERYYYGVTKNVASRIATHKHAATHKKTPLYAWMRKYPNWRLEVLGTYEVREEVHQAERDAIAGACPLCLNLAPGGEGGFVVTDKATWVKKLRKGRIGGKPALGMRHTETTKQRLREVMAERERKYPDDIVRLGCAAAMRAYGISKTHYYRLKKRAGSSEAG